MGRILVRGSGTEPVVRVMVEAETEEICQCCRRIKTWDDFFNRREYFGDRCIDTTGIIRKNNIEHGRMQKPWRIFDGTNDT